MKRNFILTVLVFLIIFLMPIEAKAATFTLDTELERTILQEGDIFKIKLRVEDIEKTSDGINAVSGFIKVDEEYLKINDINGLNNWTVIWNDEEDSSNKGKFAIITLAGSVIKDTDVAEAIVEVKRDLVSTKTNIKIEDIKTSFNNELVTAENRVHEVEIKGTRVSDTQIFLSNCFQILLGGLALALAISIAALIISRAIIVKKKEKKQN